MKAGAEILEVGAGPGRFTIELARLGAHVTVTDLSDVQLDWNRQHVASAGCEQAVVARMHLDVTDLGAVPSESFDGVVAFGGQLS